MWHVYLEFISQTIVWVMVMHIFCYNISILRVVANLFEPELYDNAQLYTVCIMVNDLILCLEYTQQKRKRMGSYQIC